MHSLRQDETSSPEGTEPRNGTAHLGFLTALIGLLLVMMATAIYTFAYGIKLETSLNSVLPKDSHHKHIQRAADTLFEKNGNRLIFIISSKNNEKAVDAAHIVIERIHNNSHVALSETGAIQDAATLIDLLSKYPANFLSDKTAKTLRGGNTEILIKEAQQRLFDFAAIGGILSPSQDPLNLFNDWFSFTYTPKTVIEREGGLSFIRNETTPNTTHIVIPFELTDETLTIESMRQIEALYTSTLTQLPNDVSITRSGIPFHAAETSSKAQRDIQLVAIGSTLGIILLFFIAFRSLSPLLLSLSSIAFGCLAAAILTHAYFGYLHIFTLVFGASLIGITVDYSLHFFVHFYGAQPPQPALHALNRILPEIATGLATSVTGFACLLFSSLPNLQQIALFSITGLTSAWLIVVVLYPKMQKPNTSPYAFRFVSTLAGAPSVFFQRIKNSIALSFSLAALFALAIFIANNTQWSSDVRMLNASSDTLLSEEEKTRNLMSLTAANQFILVTGTSAEEILIHEEQLKDALEALIDKGMLGAYSALSNYIPSKQRQKENQTLIEKHLILSGVIDRYMQTVGLSEDAKNGYHKHFLSQRSKQIDIHDWLAYAPPNLHMQWLGKLGDTYGSMITLHDIHDASAIAKTISPIPFATFVDTVDKLSLNLSAQRTQASYFLFIAYAAIALIIFLRYRQVARLKMLVVPLLSTALTLSALTLSGVAITIFHVFGLFLILGLGMDYSIFITDAKANNICSPVAIFLSAITSALSFGLLTFSSIPMIQAFGVTILLGSLFNLVLAPLAKMETQT